MSLRRHHYHRSHCYHFYHLCPPIYYRFIIHFALVIVLVAPQRLVAVVVVPPQQLVASRHQAVLEQVSFLTGLPR